MEDLFLFAMVKGSIMLSIIYNSNPDNKGYRLVKLTERGCDQVRDTFDQLIEAGINASNVCKVIVSPLPRTIETTDIVMGKLQIAWFLREVDPIAIEQNSGEREGQDYLQYKDSDFWFPEDPKSYGGASRSEIKDRMKSLIMAIINDKSCNLNKRYVVVVSHGSPLLLAQELLGLGDERLKTAGYRIISYSWTRKVFGWNGLKRMLGKQAQFKVFKQWSSVVYKGKDLVEEWY